MEPDLRAHSNACNVSLSALSRLLEPELSALPHRGSIVGSLSHVCTVCGSAYGVTGGCLSCGGPLDPVDGSSHYLWPSSRLQRQNYGGLCQRRLSSGKCLLCVCVAPREVFCVISGPHNILEKRRRTRLSSKVLSVSLTCSCWLFGGRDATVSKS